MILAFLAIIFAFFANSCAKTVYLEKEKLVEVKEYVTLTDTIIVPKIEREIVVEKIEITDTSKLQTTHALSEAWVIKGELHHTLWQKPESFKFDIQIPTLHKDSIIRIREPYPVEIIREVKYIPNIYKVCLWLIIGEVLFAVIAIVLKFKRII